MNSNFEVIGLTRLGIKPTSAASEADALTTGPYVSCGLSNFTNNRSIKFR